MNVPKLKITGDVELAKKLNRIQAGLNSNIQKSTKKAVLYVHSEIPGYPPEPAGSDYVRTGTAGRAITTFGVTPVGGNAISLSEVKPVSDGAVGYVGGAVDYLPYLIDETYQTDTHMLNGWFVLQEVVRDLKNGIVAIYTKGIKELLHG